ncbi:muts domain V-domain-containing protein [Xylariaceae sp. FL0804]|nr:muts domain V-domain-containing protein [Xylariaceae sp. FL0804]
MAPPSHGPIRPLSSMSRFASPYPSSGPARRHRSRTESTSTPHPHVISSRPTTSTSQYSSYSYTGSRAVTGSSHPSGPRHRPRTASRATASVWGSDSHEIICAVSEARGVSPTVGLAFINITTNEAILSQICDSQFYVKTIHKIQVYEPSVILMANTAFPPNPKSSLLSIIGEELPGTPVEALDRKYWSESAGIDFVQALAFRDDLEAVKVAIEGNFYATCSFAAAVKYTELSCHVTIMAHSLRIRYQPSENTMMIDISTIHSLELIQNLQNARSKDCLFGLLNETFTPMGSRVLRSNILQPSSQVENTLMPRYDALDELTSKEDMFFEVRKALKDFSDVEKLLTGLVIVDSQPSILASEQAINQVLGIKSFVLGVTPIYDALGAARTDLLARIREICRPDITQPVESLIAATINEDVTTMASPLDMRNQRTYAVKSGVHGLLDVARQTYKEASEDVYEHVEKINTELDIASDVKFDKKRQFWMRLRRSDFEDRPMPDILINRVSKGCWIECQTLALMQLNNRINDSYNEAVMLSDKVIQELLDAIREHIPSLFRICESLALLDMIASFAQSVTMRDYVRPEMTDTLALKGARHPICERVKPESFVPNDVFASEQHRFQVLTGCNMSGKSTYMRMIALLQVMAQIGCFVPAQYAAFPVIQQLFVRVSTDDSIEANMSTFSIEMREMAFILRNINGKSLAIVDELGRATSTRDGLAIALAISEALIQSNSLVWFATHFQELTKILANRPGVLNLHLATEITNQADDRAKMTMLYKITSGPNSHTNYGLYLARAIGLPEQFLATAEAVSQNLAADVEQKKEASQSRKLHRQRKLLMNLYDTLEQMASSDMDDAALGNYLNRLQLEFAGRMDDAANAPKDDTESAT